MLKLLNFDKTVTALIYNIDLPTIFTVVLNFITHLADIIFVVIALIVIAIFLFSKLKIVEAIIFVLGIFFSGLLTQALKLAFSRIRPMIARVSPEDGFSFPSGHALSAIILYGFLIWIITMLVRRKWVKHLLSLFLVLLIVIIGFSRIYLGFHWSSDVLAGWILGGVIVFLMIKLSRFLTSNT